MAEARSIGSGGETLGAELLDWATETFGVTPNEFYGQTECNLVAANNSALFPIRPGSLGRPVPGHALAIVDDEGNPVPAGTVGRVLLRSAAAMRGYWGSGPGRGRARLPRSAFR